MISGLIGWLVFTVADLCIVVPLHLSALISFGSGLAAGFTGAAIGVILAR